MHRSARKPSLAHLAVLALALAATGCHDLTSIAPDPGEPGDLVTVKGSGFLDDQGAGRVVYDGVDLLIVSWSDTEIQATLPDPKPNGTYTVQVEVRGRLSNALLHEIVTESFELLVPDGAVSFHSGIDCPPGWERLEDAEGRFLVARTDGTGVGLTAGGAPLGATEDRTHSHGFSASVNVGSKGIAGVSGGAGDVGRSGSHPTSGTTNSSDPLEAGPPRLQQLACERVVEDPEPAHDDHPYPEGAVVLFNKQGCPDGFELMGDADGRFLVPTPTGGVVGDTVGQALASGEDRSHSHGFSSSINVPSQSIAGVGGSNPRASDGTKNFSGTTNASTSGVPYLQLLSCIATDRPDPLPGEPITGDLLPPDTFSFFDLDICPEGWSRSGLHEGRFLSGLRTAADGAVPYETRGGPPLLDGEDRTHTHGFSGSVNVPNERIALIIGCCNGGFGQHGNRSYSGTTAPASLGLPYISLLGCEKD